MYMPSVSVADYKFYMGKRYKTSGNSSFFLYEAIKVMNTFSICLPGDLQCRERLSRYKLR